MSETETTRTERPLSSRWQYRSQMAGFRDPPARLKHADLFLCVHFVFHAGEGCKGVGRNPDREMADFILDESGPNYLQFDSKSHGVVSSPRIGTPPDP